MPTPGGESFNVMEIGPLESGQMSIRVSNDPLFKSGDVIVEHEDRIMK